MKPWYFIALTIVLSVFALSACTKSAKSGQPSGSEYTGLMCRTDSFHYSIAGYQGTPPAPYLHSSNVGMTIKLIDASTVSIDEYIFKYDANSADSLLTFNVTNAPDWHTWGFNIKFNRFTNIIRVHRDYYISAGGGSTAEDWVSF